MPVVVPLSEKAAKADREAEATLDRILKDATCEHIAYEVMGVTVKEDGTDPWERRKCSDCGLGWATKIPGPSIEQLDEAREALGVEQPGQPPKAVYGHAQVITYQTDKAQYDLVVGELAMVSVQNGVLVLQHHDAPIVGVVGVRPWLEPGKEGDDDGAASGV